MGFWVGVTLPSGEGCGVGVDDPDLPSNATALPPIIAAAIIATIHLPVLFGFIPSVDICSSMIDHLFSVKV